MMSFQKCSLILSLVDLLGLGRGVVASYFLHLIGFELMIQDKRKATNILCKLISWQPYTGKRAYVHYIPCQLCNRSLLIEGLKNLLSD